MSSYCLSASLSLVGTSRLFVLLFCRFYLFFSLLNHTSKENKNRRIYKYNLRPTFSIICLTYYNHQLLMYTDYFVQQTKCCETKVDRYSPANVFITWYFELYHKIAFANCCFIEDWRAKCVVSS